MKYIYGGLGTILLIAGFYIFAITGFTFFAFQASLSFENSYEIVSTALLSTLVGTHFWVRGIDSYEFCRPFVKVIQFILLILYFACLLMVLYQDMTASVEETLPVYFSSDNTMMPGHAFISFWLHDTVHPDSEVVLKYFFKNIILFMPLGFLLPCIFRIMHNSIFFTFILLFFSIAMEMLLNTLQVISLDIDVIILHITGGLLAYIFCRIPIVNDFLVRWYAMDDY